MELLLKRNGTLSPASIRAIRKIIYENVDLNSADGKHSASPSIFMKKDNMSVLSKLIKYVHNLYTLDHYIENKNSDLESAVLHAKEGHMYALEIKKLLPLLQGYELEPAMVLLRGLSNVNYLTILGNSIDKHCPNGYWWKNLYKELEDKTIEYLQRRFLLDYIKNYVPKIDGQTEVDEYDIMLEFNTDLDSHIHKLYNGSGEKFRFTFDEVKAFNY